MCVAASYETRELGCFRDDYPRSRALTAGLYKVGLNFTNADSMSPDRCIKKCWKIGEYKVLPENIYLKHGKFFAAIINGLPDDSVILPHASRQVASVTFLLALHFASFFHIATLVLPNRNFVLL